MIYVTNRTDVFPLIHYHDLDVTKKIDGSLTLSLVSLKSNYNPGHSSLEAEAVITVDDMDYRIKQLTEYRTHKELSAVSTFFDLNDTRKNTLFDDTATFDDFANFALGGTTWNFTSDITATNYIPDFGNANVIELVNRLCEAYRCEYEIRPNKNIVFSNMIGPDNNAQYRYGYNVSALSRFVDTTQLKTLIRGTGAPGISAVYEAPSSAQFGVKEADPINDTSIENVNDLMLVLQRSIKPFPLVSFELDSIELMDKEVGERVWLIYEPLGIELPTRIMSTSKTMQNDELRTYKVTLGNNVPKTTVDLLVEARQFAEQSKRSIARTVEQHQKNLQQDMEKLMVLGVPELY